MRQIEITTTQNVTIQYELASPWQRILAFLLDFIVIMFMLGILSLIVILATNSTLASNVVSAVFFFFYTPISEILFNGQTIGKMALGTRVVKLSGKQPSFSDYMIRWAFRMIDIYFSVGSVGILMIVSTDNGQRVGGLLSNTTVVKKDNSYKLDLGDLLRLTTRDKYEPKYPSVTRLTEEDMLLVKSAVERYRKFPNKAHKEAISMLCDRLKDILNLDEIPKQRLQFLRQLIRDYVVLTR